MGMSEIVVGVLAGTIASWTTWLIAQRRIAVEHITAERAKWRETIRRLALDVHDALERRDRVRVKRLKSQFGALLNPRDSEDQRLLACIAVPKRWDDDRAVKRFSRGVSLLLKHDWDRAKLEAGFFLLRWIFNIRRHPLKPRRAPCKARWRKVWRPIARGVGLGFWHKYEVKPAVVRVLLFIIGACVLL